MFFRLTAGLAAFSTNIWPLVVGEAMLSSAVKISLVQIYLLVDKRGC